MNEGLPSVSVQTVEKRNPKLVFRLCTDRLCWGVGWDFPVPGSRFRRLHLVCDSAVSARNSPIKGPNDIDFPLSTLDRHTEVLISGLYGWPAFPSAQTVSTMTLPPSHLCLRPQSLAKPSS
ncbi:hypothetical protein Poly41_48440 [Novipirellula artificiosorum]|uniref:Uncharacterized protein n=1 Tax=Novipirellula artificiosorum TaxID=2528016 RepID=A0A5C6DD88_9BACT|nr:hypothetical protein Poly41_48440 [Novipirellula artificiosorum]